jgi:salicylate hydroxylase
VRPIRTDLRMPRVAIVGGGLAGLSCALSLQRAGIPVTVYERDSSLAARKQGYGLTLTNNPVGALHELGVLEECIRGDCLSTAHWVLKPDGQILGYYGRGLQDSDGSSSSMSKSSASPSPSPCPSPSPSPSSSPSSIPAPSPSPSLLSERESSASLRIPREELRRMLHDRLAPGTVKWGCRLKDYEERRNMAEEGAGDRSADGPITLLFEDGTTQTVDLLVGADGIHSVVRRLRDQKEKDAQAGLKYLEVAVILGISTASHPLLDARGIYVVDGVHRLFTMPFRPPVLDASGGVVEPQQTMWQLSFHCSSESEALSLKRASSSDLMEFALERTKGWMVPVQNMIRQTPVESIWSTPLYDRDPMRLRSKNKPSFVTVAGDAAHPMSMFKGQGANQALQDGPALAQWLRHQHSSRRDTTASADVGMTRDSLLTRIRQYESEIVHRSTPRVMDSRRAAAWYHSPAACELSTTYGLGANIGVRPGEVTVVEVLGELHRQNISAALDDGAGLEEKVKATMRQLAAKWSLEREASGGSVGVIRRRQIKQNKTGGEEFAGPTRM